ncbi:MAG: hypothetical protein AAFV59_14975 [Pseudomonadota bacterium]
MSDDKGDDSSRKAGDVVQFPTRGTGMPIPPPKALARSNIPPLPGIRDRVDYFPKQLVDYVKNLLLEYKKEHSLTHKELRDLIMLPEDEQATKQAVEYRVVKEGEKERDTRLPLETFRKWLREGSDHKLEATSFAYVHRFYQQNITRGELISIDRNFMDARRGYHQNALADLFRLRYADIKPTLLLDGFAGYFAGHSTYAREPNILMRFGTFNKGISDAMTLFGRGGDVTEDPLSLEISYILQGYFVIQVA